MAKNENEVVFTMPGKAGDSLHQWPIAYHWAKQHKRKFTVWLDQQTCKVVAPLYANQPCVDKVELIGGVENWSCGGQPFHFNLPTSKFIDKTVYHLGLRKFPSRQLTLECMESSKVPITVEQDVLSEEPSISSLHKNGKIPPEKLNRLILHGQGVCPHTGTTPMFWRFIHRIKDEINQLFDEVVMVGSEDDREVAKRTYPEWRAQGDGGDFFILSKYMAQARCVIGCGSSVVSLAGAMKVPCIRVHDEVGQPPVPKSIFSNLGKNQLNATEIELRELWPEWRDKWLVHSSELSSVS